jgi:hypothetical protein
MESIHVVLDQYVRGPSDIIDPSIHDPCPNPFPCPTTTPALKTLVISGQDEHIDNEIVFTYLRSWMDKETMLPLLILRDMKIVIDIGFNAPEIKGKGRFEKLIFDNVQYCFTDEITLSGPSEPKDMDVGWKVLPLLLQRANVVRIMHSTGYQITDMATLR